MTARIQTPQRESLTKALHRHTCGTDYDEWNQPCSWAGEDWDPDDGPATCAYVDEVGVEDAVFAWVATLADDDALVEQVARAYNAKHHPRTPWRDGMMIPVRGWLRALATALTERPS